MKDVSSKADNTTSLPAEAFNSMVSEMENAVTDAGLTLDNGSETTADPNPTQISAAIYMAGRDADAFTDSGSANAYTLTKIRGKVETAYRNGARFRFVPANTNTGASTVNIQSIGAKNIRFGDNSDLTAGAIQANIACEIYYDLSADNFKVINPIASGNLPGQYKAGAAPGYTGGSAIAAGNIGERRTSSFSGIPATTSGTNLTSFSNVTKGVYILKVFTKATIGSSTRLQLSASSTSATIDTTAFGDTYQDAATDYTGGTTSWIGRLDRYLKVDADIPTLYITAQSVNANTGNNSGFTELIRIA